jgi:plastocyanin
MSRIYRALACGLLLAGLAACGSDSSKSGEPSSPKAAPDAKKVDLATAGNISGKVVLEGTPPENPVIKTGSDPACGSGELRGESYVVDKGALQNVFVYIKDGLGNKYIFETPTESVKLDQKGCHYAPHVVGVRVTQPLEIINSDNTMHNVHGMPDTNREFNFGQVVAGMKNTVTFTAPEVMIPFKCDVHSWMNAYIGVVNHPYFAVTGSGGTFELKTVPPGTYTVEAWHEKLGRQTQSVTLGEKDNKELTFTFKVQ